jgi:hypothetical protein
MLRARRYFLRCWPVAFVITSLSCARSSPVDGIDVLAEFKSELGNKITCPASWNARDDGDTWTITSTDGHAKILVLSFTVEGTGSKDEFDRMIVESVEREHQVQRVSDGEFSMKSFAAKRTDLAADAKQDEISRVIFTLQAGELYHAIILSATPLAMQLNRGFYEEAIASFQGASSLP